MKSADLDIEKLIQLGPTEQADWLPESSPVATFAVTMAALANRSGGILIVGADGKNISGIADTEKIGDLVLDAALTIQPALIISMPQVVSVKGKNVILVHIPAGLPHIYAYEGRYVQRENTSNIPLNPSELRRLMLRRGAISFESELAQSVSLSDIDWEKATNYAASLRGVSDINIERLLLRRGCLSEVDKSLRPTHAGLLLFGKDPQRFIRGADITAVRFAGETMGDTFMRQDITGTLPDQIRRAETFLVDHLRKDVKLKHTMERQEVYEYPLEAARELVVNAVAHRDYSINGDGIRLYIFSNHMDVYSPGGLPGPVTINNIKDERYSRNPVIVQVLADMGFIERLGYGVDRVIELMQRRNLRAPDFQERAGGFQVILYNTQVEIERSLSISEKSVPSETKFRSIYNGVAVNPRQEAAIEFLAQAGNARITNSDLQNLFPDVHTETIRRDLVDLVNKNIFTKMGEKRGSYYILTTPQTQPEPAS